MRVDTLIRKIAGEKGLCIKIVSGPYSPKVEGYPGWYETRFGSGVVCRHPNAYRRHFGRPYRHPSTRQIEVGTIWLSRLISFYRDFDGAVDRRTLAIRVKETGRTIIRAAMYAEGRKR